MNFDIRHLFLFTLLINHVSADLFVTANTFDLIGFVGKGVTMYATVRGDPRPTADDITWIKMQGNMPEERVLITYDLATNESRLRINDLEYSDEGTYYCTASINGVSKSVSMTLRVVVEPEVFRVTGLMSFKAVGQSVTLSVTVNGSPIPTADDITWAKMDERSIPMPITHDRFELNNGNKELTISNLIIDDEGWYKCLVKTDEGKAEASFRVYVLGMRSIQETEVGVVGNSATMSCKATYVKHVNSNTPTTINWYRYGAPDTPLSGTTQTEDSSSETATSILTLTDLDWADDGEYFCTSSYTGFPDHSIYNATLHIRGVSESPTLGTAVLGQSARFQCTAIGDIEPSFTWTRNELVVDGDTDNVFDSSSNSTTSTFTYSGVKESDTTAEFRCVADFDGQTHQSQPASVSALKVTTAPVGVYGVVGGSASLSCIASGAPTPGLFTWFRDGTEVDVKNTVTFPSETSAKSEITISELSREDHGDYTCVPDYNPDLENLFMGGTTSSSPGKLSVIGLTEPPEQTIVKVGDRAVFTCKANAVPVPTLSWFKSGSTITSGVSSPKTVGDEVVCYLTINNVGDNDVAPYSCKADYPSLGSHLSEDAFLRFRGIEEPPLITPAVIGMSGELNCTARGEAEAELKWLANGTEIVESDENFSIFTASNFDPAKQQDLIDTRTVLSVSTVSLPVSFLEITCSATWTGQNGESSEVLSDPVKFDPLYVYRSPENTIAVRYTTVELSCSATRTPLIRWDRSGRTYGVGLIDIDGTERTHSTLRIGNVTEADQGKIWCVAEYEGGMHDSDKAELTVVGITSEPQTETLSARGTNVEFTCVVDRYPPNTVAWYKGEDKIQEYDNRKDMTMEEKDLFVEHKLSISSVTEEDMGPYHCKVEYPQGEQISQPAYLQIREPAQITLIVATGGDKAGESMELLCQASGVPTPTITWRRSGKEFPNDQTSSVVTVYNEPGSSLVLINSTTTEDQGIYSCVASNGVGDPVIMETEVILEAAVAVVTVASASSLLVFIIAVCTAVMLFALYRRRKRKNALHPEEDKVPPTTPVEEEERDLENHVYDNEAIQPPVQFSLTKATTKIHR